MKDFADLYFAIDETNRTNAKVAALVRYFAAAEPGDAAWAIYVLSGRKLRQVVPTKKLVGWARDRAGIAQWLFDECYQACGDLAETITLVLPAPVRVHSRRLSAWVEDVLVPLRTADETVQRSEVLSAWDGLTPRERFVFNKLITGSLRVGVSQALLTRALAEVAGTDAATTAHRLMGNWEPTPAFYENLLRPDSSAEDHTRPYPFFLATQLESTPPELGELADWQAEWKWDGIRAQLVKRGGEALLWSRGEELVTDRFPEVVAAAQSLPDGTVIDGELLPWRGGRVLPFAQMQRRIGRKVLGKKILADVPVVLVVYDLLEVGGRDIRTSPLAERRQLLDALIDEHGGERLQRSPLVVAQTWDELAVIRTESRSRLCEGFMLKRKSSPYRTGRVRGDWWKWKIDPLTVDCVLIGAQGGSGKRAGLFTDYTFGVWDGGTLVPFAKAYSGLTDAEIKQVDAFVRANTSETFGPARAVTPKLVFELAFEGIQRSPRHRSGVAVRFPRILRQRHDKSPKDADTLDSIRALLPPEASSAVTEEPDAHTFVQRELFA